MALTILVPGAVGDAMLDGESFADVTVVSVGEYFCEFRDSQGSHFFTSSRAVNSFAPTGTTTVPTPLFAVGIDVALYWSVGAYTAEVLGVDGPFIELDFGGGNRKVFSYLSTHKIL